MEPPPAVCVLVPQNLPRAFAHPHRRQQGDVSQHPQLDLDGERLPVHPCPAELAAEVQCGASGADQRTSLY